MILACSGLGTAVTFCGHFLFGFQVYFLCLIKYTCDYPHMIQTMIETQAETMIKATIEVMTEIVAQTLCKRMMETLSYSVMGCDCH
jgi:hypothetical protein